MYKHTFSYILIVFLLIVASLQNAIAFDDDLNKSILFVESLEWDDEALQKIEAFRQFEPIYLDLLKSADSNRIFVASVMLGLLKTKEAEPLLHAIQSKETNVAIGVSFALCRLNIRYQENYIFLEKTGYETQMVGGAVSQKHLESIELMSFLGDNRFPSYIKTLKTEEVFQHEAISVALERHKKIKKGL